jgi:8-oxo-dGTP diphosphatase
MGAPQHETPRHSVSVSGVILDATATRVLLIQRRDNNHWEPPGGVLELDETIDEGLRREIEEEAGVTVRVDALTGVYKNMSRGIVNLVFRCTALTEPTSSTAEALTVTWVPIRDVENLMDSAYSVRVVDALSDAVVSVRAHDGVRVVEEASCRR